MTRQLPTEPAARLRQVIADLVQEMRPHLRAPIALTEDTHLERDLGLDSLSRTELLHRLERAFGVSLPDAALAAETPRELLRSVLAAGGAPEVIADLKYPAPQAAGPLPEQAATLLEVLDWHVDQHPSRIAIHLYGNQDQPERELTYQQLQQSARAVAAGLIDKGLDAGQSVAIMLPTSADYFFSFYGVLLAGGVPVPIYPPVRPSQLEEHLRRHGKILDNAQAFALITVPEARTVARLLQTQAAALRHVVTAAELLATRQPWRRPAVQPHDTAFLQYTSGSTGDPKGVVLSHANLLANLRAIGVRMQVSATDVFVSWLPLYHDMGLIGAFLGTQYFAVPLVIMSPLSFLARPARWLWAIHRHRGTLSAAPNFAYELCLRHIDDNALAGLDLSSLRMIFNGAEPVSPDTMERFFARFRRCGLRAEALAPVYGLAESTVGLALPPPAQGFVIDRLQRDVFMRTGQALPADPDDPNPLRFASCGPPLPGHQIRVVDEQGRELPERQEGRLEFQGPSATSGYYRNPAATRGLFHGDWLDSGDRAYLAGGDVYLTGRVKDIIIRGGRNFYPYELEDVVGGLAGVRKGCVAAFASGDPETGTERLVVVAETRETDASALADLRRQIQAASVELLGAPPDDVVLAAPHAVLKTSSGKIRRSAVRELYDRQALGQGTPALWRQFLRMAAAGVAPPLRRWRRRLLETLYAAYAWVVFLALGPPVWIGIMALPRKTWRWAWAGGAVRLLMRLTRTPFSVEGLANLPAGPCVLAANHASYLDAYVLAAAIPRPFGFVAKRELMDSFIVRAPLARLGTLFIERFDPQRSAEGAAQATASASAGQMLMFFPEGTFDRMPGLQPFRMGAFVTAAQAGVPVVPIAIRGARSILRAYSWFPRRGSVRVVVESSVQPEGNDWPAAVKLRDATRQAILRHCGEPDLAEEKFRSPAT